jgi:hypothetical protein
MGARGGGEAENCDAKREGRARRCVRFDRTGEQKNHQPFKCGELEAALENERSNFKQQALGLNEILS